MNSWKDNADKVSDEMFHPNSVNIAETKGAEGVPEEKSNDTPGLIEDISHVELKSVVQPQSVVFEDLNSATTLENLVDAAWDVSKLSDSEAEKLPKPIASIREVLVNEDLKTLDKRPKPFPTDIILFSPINVAAEESSFLHEMEDETVLEDIRWMFEGEDMSSPLKLEGVDVAHQLFDEMPDQPSVQQQNKKCELNISHLQLVPWLDNEIWLGEISRFVFDPGGSSLPVLPSEQPYMTSYIWCILHSFVGHIQLNDVLYVVGYISVEALVVYAEYGGQDKNCEEIVAFTKVDCCPFESNNAEQDFDELMINNVDSDCTTPRWKAWPKVATMLGLMPLRVTHLPQSAAKLFSLVGLWAINGQYSGINGQYSGDNEKK